jgi:selenocysteine-specific elongation factor
MSAEGKRALPLMLGTAGHVDHGKTSLVRNLTGFDPDHLKEEKERGLTIDMGVAPWEIEGLGRLGVIDVPGHEDFIRNMVSGAASIDILLLVVAADDAVMPQTEEHLRILRILGVREIVVVITKIDLVDAEMLELVQDDIAQFLESSGIEPSGIFQVSNTSLQGIEELKAHLSQIVEEKGERYSSEKLEERAFRMYVRHYFSLKGHGTVVTGVPCAGVVEEGAALELLPNRLKTSVRGIQTYRHAASRSQAHTSSAINLRDLDLGDIERGMCLATPGVFSPSTSIVVLFRNEHPSQIIGKRGEYRFLAGTAAIVCRMRLLGVESLEPGEQAFVLITFAQSAVFAAGDRFIVRILSPADTIGGGQILGCNVRRVRSNSSFLLPRLEKAKQALEVGDYFKSALYSSDQPILDAQELNSFAQCESNKAKELLAKAVEDGTLKPISNSQWLISERIEEIRDRLKKHLERYHRENPLAQGMQSSYVAALFRVEASAAAAFVQLLVDKKEIVTRHSCIALGSFKPQITEKQLVLRRKLEELLVEVGAASIAKGDILSRLDAKDGDLKKVSKMMADEGVLTVLGSNYILRKHMDEFRQSLLDLFRKQEVIELKEVRDATGTSRNLAVMILESFDAEGLTKRKGNGRVLAQKDVI